MKVMELIQWLEDFKEKHGDLKVCIDGECVFDMSKGMLLSDESEEVCLICSQYEKMKEMEDEEDEEEDEEEEDKYKLWGAIVNDIRKIR